MQIEDLGAPEYSLALPAGVQLAGAYTLRRLLSAASDYALTYLGEDAGGHRVIVKEFLPRSFVGRAPDGCTVRPHTAQDEQQFARSLRRFAREADLLAQLNHPHVARVQRVLEANGTAYAVLDWRDALPLADNVAEQGAMAPRAATELILQLLDALATLHGEGIVHRFISPESVLVDDATGPLLLALTAKRHVVTHGQGLMAGYAALEQYGAKDIGPWTDVYASGALLYFLLTGAAPPSAVDRAAGQTLDSLASALGDVAPSLSRVLMRALALLPDQRPHGARELQRQLESAMAASGTLRPVLARPGYPPASAPAEVGDDGRGAALRLAEGGIVVPNDGRGGLVARLLRLARRSPTRRADDADAVLLETLLAERTPAAAPVPAPAHAAVRRDARQVARAPEADPAAALVSQPPTELPVAALPVLAPAKVPAAEEDPPQEHFFNSVLETEPEPLSRSRRWYIGRRSLAAAAVVAILMLTAGITYAARLSKTSPPRHDRAVGMESRAGVAALASRRETPADSHVVALHAGDTPGAVLQGAASHVLGESAGSIASSHAPVAASSHGTSSGSSAAARSAGREAPAAASRAARHVAAKPDSASGVASLPAPVIDVAVPVAEPQLRFLPPTLIPDIRLRLTSGKAFMEQGQYESARRAFRQALDQVDSATARYSNTEALRAMRRDIEQADREAVQACTAENEVRRTRGAKLLQCQ